MDLHRVGAIIRTMHDTGSTFREPKDAQWCSRYEGDESQIICHNDLAPWNLVCGTDRWVFIDWDAAAPGTRLWDLAWASISFPPFTLGCDLPTAANAMKSLLNGYCLEGSSYGKLIRLMVTRARSEYNVIVAGAEKGQQPWTNLYSEQHHVYWGGVAEFVERHASVIEHLLRQIPLTPRL